MEVRLAKFFEIPNLGLGSDILILIALGSSTEDLSLLIVFSAGYRYWGKDLLTLPNLKNRSVPQFYEVTNHPLIEPAKEPI